MPKYQFSQFKLKNNLTVLHLPIDSSESVLVSLIGKVGRRAEKDQEIGAAHFLEHLFFDGTKTRPTALEINKFLDEYGGEHNGLTSQETVEYYVKILADKAEVAFKFLSDIFLNSLISEIEKEKNVIGQEAAAKKDNPVDILLRLNLVNLYPGQSIGRNIFDEVANLPNISQKLLREYMDRTYIAENFVLAIAGNISEEKAKKWATQYFEPVKKGNEIIFDQSNVRKEQNVVITKKDLTQSKLAIIFKGFSINSQESVTTGLLCIIMGGEWSSRLFERLRSQQQLVYSVRAYQRKFSDSGFFGIQTYVDETNVQKATDAIFEEIDKLLNNGISDDELEKAKNTYLSSFLFGLEDLNNYASYFSNQLLLKKEIKSVEEIKMQINNCTKENIVRISKQIFSDTPKVDLVTKNLDNLVVRFK
jgi:predicted Zn-dependent peptidase